MRMKVFSLCIAVVFFNSLYAQKPTAAASKLPQGVSKMQLMQEKLLYVTSTTDISFGKKVHEQSGYNIYLVDIKQVSLDSLLKHPFVIFIQPARSAKEEERNVVLNNSDKTVNEISFAHNQFESINGKALTVNVKENIPDTSDIDFKERYKVTGKESATLSSHATVMATLIAGAGNSYYTGKGVAWKSNISSLNFETLLPEGDTFYSNRNISVQNHSYGTAIENFYGADAMAYDASTKNLNTLLHIFSSGNSGSSTSNAGNYAGVTAFANLTGSFKQSKNSLSVGATDSFYKAETLSSRGPTYDGRIKPELVAYGQDGSSGAAALVSGTALLVQDAFKQMNGNLPPAALVKAALINSAVDILNAGPDFISGFGSLNAERAVRSIVSNQFVQANVSTGGVQQFNLAVPANATNLKITLAWTDVAPAPNAVKALVNDLDLEVVETATGNIYLPWVLSRHPHVDSLNKPATRKRDTLNNVEQVTLQFPAAGNYTISIKGTSVQSIQAFAIAYQWDTINSFQFTYPTLSDNIFPAQTNVVRWRSTFATTGELEISYNNGIAWQVLQTGVDLSKKYAKAFIKDTIAVAKFRMKIGSQYFNSDSFTISQKVQTAVRYNCADSFLITWNRLKNVNNYKVYGLVDSLMRPLYQTPDTFLVIHPNNIEHFAVAPVINSITGVRSFAFNYKTQGVSCYVKDFLADNINDSTIRLTAVLGTTFGVQQLTFERLNPITQLASFTVNRDSFVTADKIRNAGVYYYRIKLVLTTGQIIYSDVISLTILKDEFYVYPNPIASNQKLTLQGREFDNHIVQLYSVTGNRVFTYSFRDQNASFHLPALARGIYFYTISRKGAVVYRSKLIVQ